MTGIIFLLLGRLLAGRLLARLESMKSRRFFGWLMVLGCLGLSHVALIGSDPILRMAGLCAILKSGPDFRCLGVDVR